MPEADARAVAIVDDDGLSAAGKLAAALDRAGLWTLLRRKRSLHGRRELDIVIRPELSAFSAGSPTATDPALVEALIDALHDAGYANVAVVGAADSSALWADNRELYALTDLLGYRYVTPKQRPYDIVDLADEQVEAAFGVAGALHGCTISRRWLQADLRIVFSKSRTDEAAGYALCLDTLIGVLPLIDQDLHYRRRRRPGDVVAALLDAAPVEFCLIDAIVAAHGPSGRRAPLAIQTGTIIAATDIVLADDIGARKMGLDPKVSQTFARAARTHPLPQRYIVAGSLDPYVGWDNVPPVSLQAARACAQAETFGRLIEPWLQRVDPALFPLKNPVDARLNGALAEYFAAPSNRWLLTLVNCLLAWIDTTIGSYRVLFDKDALRRQAVPLGLDLACATDDAFGALVDELHRLEPLAEAATSVSQELAWRYVGDAVVFRYARLLPIGFDRFVQRIDIARTIQFMNDYLGGVLVPLAHDASGRPVRQAERNIYLPQPNYLVLFEGKPIDVSKLEVVEYGNGRHRLYWKTLLSENASAVHDDGIATFERRDRGTEVTITGRQQFALPLFFQVFDPDVVPGLKPRLVTHAYQTFFDRTMANFEALVEGRDISIGRPVDEPAPPPMERLMPTLQRLAEAATPLLRRFTNVGEPMQQSAPQADADGFVHVVPEPLVSSDADRLSAEITRFVTEFGQAIARDMTLTGRAA